VMQSVAAYCRVLQSVAVVAEAVEASVDFLY